MIEFEDAKVRVHSVRLSPEHIPYAEAIRKAANETPEDFFEGYGVVNEWFVYTVDFPDGLHCNFRKMAETAIDDNTVITKLLVGCIDIIDGKEKATGAFSMYTVSHVDHLDKVSMDYSDIQILYFEDLKESDKEDWFKKRDIWDTLTPEHNSFLDYPIREDELTVALVRYKSEA